MSKGGGVIVKCILYRVADTKGGFRGEGFVKIILFCVTDTKDGLRGKGFCLRYIVSCRGY